MTVTQERSPLRSLRFFSNLTLVEVARRAHCSPATLSLLERGLINPNPNLARRVALALGVTVSDVFPGLELPAEKVETPRAGRG